MQEHATTRIKRTKCFTTVTKIILNLPDNIETCNWGGCDNALFKQGNPLSDLGMLPGYAEAQRDYGYRLPGSDNDDAVIPVAQSERGAIDDEVELAKSQFLRSEKAGYQTGAFDGRDISRAGDTMTALFRKNYGYTPSAGELIQYANLNGLDSPHELSVNHVIGTPSLERLHQSEVSQSQLNDFWSRNTEFKKIRTSDMQ